MRIIYFKKMDSNVGKLLCTFEFLSHGANIVKAGTERDREQIRKDVSRSPINAIQTYSQVCIACILYKRTAVFRNILIVSEAITETVYLERSVKF